MPAKYCPRPSCSAKTEYTIKPPLYCSACGQEYAKAFAVVAAPQSTETQPLRQAVRAAPPQPVMSSRNVALYRKPAALRGVPQTEGQSDDIVTSRDVALAREEGREIAASMSAADFGIVIRADQGQPLTLGALFKNPDQYQIGQRTADTSSDPIDE